MSGTADVELLRTGVEAFQPPQDVVSSAMVSLYSCDCTVIDMKFGIQIMKVTM